MSTLHDRIEELADEWERQATDVRAGMYGSGMDDAANTLDNAARRLRAVLAETTTEYDGAAHATAVGVEVARALRGLRCGFVEPAEPEPDEREALAAGEDVDRRLLWLDRAAPTPWKVRVVTDGLPSNGPGGHAVVDANGLALVQTDYDEHGYHLAHLIAQAPDLYRARAALAAAQPVEPEPDAAPQEDPCAGHYHDAWSPPGSRPDCQPAQHVEPEPDQGGGDA